MLFKIYIGHNNNTKKLEEKKALDIINGNFKGFTSYKGLGYWEGKAEKTLIIELETPREKPVISLCKKLARDLQQDAIGLAKIGSIQFVTV